MRKLYSELSKSDKLSLSVINLYVLWSSFDFIGWYKVWLGADGYQYSFYIKYFIEGESSIGYEQGVHYFWFLSLLIRPLWLGAVTGYFNFWDTWAYHLGVLFGNTILFIILANVVYLLFKKLFTNTGVVFLASLNFLLLTPIYYSRLLIKPDLLTILLFIIFIFVLTEEKVFLVSNSKSYIIFSIFFGFMFSTKFTISIVSTFILVAYLAIHNFNNYSYKKIMIFFLLAIIFASILIVHSETITQRYIWDTPRAEPLYGSAPLEYFINFSPMQTYDNPLRDNLKDSFLSIWLVDFYGDYWEVYFLSKNSALDISDTKLLWARLCFILSIIANLVYIVSIIFKLKRKIIKNYDGVLFSLAFLIGPFSLIIIETLLGWFKATEGDPTKTTYFGFLFIFFIISIFSFLDSKWERTKYYTIFFTIVLFLTRLPFLFSNTLSIPETLQVLKDPLSSPIENVVPYFDHRCIYTEVDAKHIIESKGLNGKNEYDVLVEYQNFRTDCSGKVFDSNYLGGQILDKDTPIILIVSK